jgi:hypothetical protein
MELIEKRICPICNGRENEVLFHQSFSDFSDITLLASYDVVACVACGYRSMKAKAKNCESLHMTETGSVSWLIISNPFWMIWAHILRRSDVRPGFYYQ